MGSRAARCRFFEYGELPLVLLALLKKRSMSGYELMSELARLFSPRYTPSAGSVYPALVAALQARLDELGWIECRMGVFLRPEGSVDGELERLIGLVKEHLGMVDPQRLVGILEQTQNEAKKLVRTKGGN